MSVDPQRRALSLVLQEAARLGEEVRQRFGPLGPEQVNWKPAEGEWSVGQCLEHLVISNQPYVQIFEDSLAGRRRRRLWERMPLLPDLFGKFLIGALHPETGRPVKARPAFRPSSSRLEPAIVGRFLDQHAQLARLMEASGRLDLDGTIITSPVLGLIIYSLMDACRIIVVHEMNHVAQARRVMESAGFPR